LILGRVAMEPMRQYLSNQLYFAGQEWEKKQQVAEARATEHHAPAAGWLTREFRVTNAASGTLDSKFFEQTDVLLFAAPIFQILLPVCISTIEAGHATIRRRVEVQSTQTHGVDIEALSAQHVVGNVRRRRSSTQIFKDDPCSTGTEDDAPADGAPVEADAGTGLADTSELSARYHALGGEAFQNLVEIGKAATE
ncbi:unnamed protein product, partial [Prorocentrum cordatum]